MAPGDYPEKIAKYARYYSGATYNGHRTIMGEMVLPDNKFTLKSAAGRHVVSLDAFPVVADGGCSVVWLLYDTKTSQMLWIRCNPVR